ncbi:hypothetical protein Hte_011651 [Hypoxylon texense]
MAAAGVPTHRQFLTSLIDSLTSVPVPATPSSAAAPNAEGKNNNNNNNNNPLKLVPPACRPLFTTLYALYPLILLPALDLLDRRLATRVFVGPHRQQQDTTAKSETGAKSDLQLGLVCDDDKDGNKEEEEGEVAAGNYSSTPRSNSYYIVRSAQQQQTRRHGWGSNASPSGLLYVVRLDAWNCTCAAFAFAAFPREDNQQHSYVIEPASSKARKRGMKKEGRVEGQSEKWEFGALSIDGREGSGIAGVPCCKHLLACLLAERWHDLLGGYVEERIVGREEGVGLVADI